MMGWSDDFDPERFGALCIIIKDPWLIKVSREFRGLKRGGIS
jgi:hypothetical protein